MPLRILNFSQISQQAVLPTRLHRASSDPSLKVRHPSQEYQEVDQQARWVVLARLEVEGICLRHSTTESNHPQPQALA